MDHRQFNAHKIMEAHSPFNLNQALLNWREALGASPALPSQTVEELESHLLGSLEALRAKGLSEEEAFYVAARRVGPADTLCREFAKINAVSVWSDRALWTLMGMFSGTLLLSCSSYPWRISPDSLPSPQLNSSLSPPSGPSSEPWWWWRRRRAWRSAFIAFAARAPKPWGRSFEES